MKKSMSNQNSCETSLECHLEKSIPSLLLFLQTRRLFKKKKTHHNFNLLILPERLIYFNTHENT